MARDKKDQHTETLKDVSAADMETPKVTDQTAEQQEQDVHTELVLDDGRIEKIEEFQSPEKLYADLIARVKKYHPSDDISLIEKAYQTAAAFHQGQVRKSGEPYIIHPLCVAIILADMEMDKETIVAGILHDVVEDTVMTGEEIREQFGADVELLVDGVTKLGQLQYSTDKLDQQAENLRKMFLAMAKDIRVIMIKLADRLHNMRTLDYMRPEKQQEKARETLDIYSPIANRLGISKLKVDLDDLSLKYLEPEVYKELVSQIAIRKSVREQYIQSIVDEVSVHIANAGIKAKIDGRVKHFFSIYRKMVNQNKTIDQIYDLFAVRIIVDSVKDCYAALGVIHEIYRPIPGRFKDYIAVPKANMYQSLHTTLIGTNGTPFEIQIRTYEMHKTAEYGIAAHWKYKEASDGKKVETQEEEKLTWLRRILEWQKDLSDNQEFMEFLKKDLDLFSDQVYCFTPTGDIKNLPAGSTPIDFAYLIHTAVGNQMVGARVNGKLVTIDYEIKNGDCIEIMTSQNSHGPSRDWLNFVKSSHARNKINQWFKNEYREENIIRGKELLASYCKSKSIILSDLLKSDIMEEALQKFSVKDWEAMLASIGHGALKEGQVINRMLEIYDRKYKEPASNEQIMETIKEKAAVKKIVPSGKGNSGVIVHGMGDIAARFGKCCNPLPGDEVIGFVTRGRGVSIHRTDCANIISLQDIDRGRLVDVEWAPDAEQDGVGKYMVEIIIYATNRSGLLADISKCMSDWNIDISSLSTKVNKDQNASINMAFPVGSREEMNRIIEKLKKVPSVVDIDRTANS